MNTNDFRLKIWQFERNGLPLPLTNLHKGGMQEPQT